MPRSRSDTFLETREERAAALSRSRNLGVKLMNINTILPVMLSFVCFS